MLDGGMVYRATLREYYEIHDAIWNCIGTKECEYLVERMGKLMAKLDTLKPDWYKQPKPVDA